MAFSDNVRRLREAIGITQSELAKRVGVTQPTIAQYEMGIKVPTRENPHSDPRRQS